MSCLTRKLSPVEATAPAAQALEDARNKPGNNSVKKAKRKYFFDNLDANKSDPRKTWRLINELQSRQIKSTTVSQVKTGNQVFTSPGDIARAFNNYFANITQSLSVEGVFSFHRTVIKLRLSM